MTKFYSKKFLAHSSTISELDDWLNGFCDMDPSHPNFDRPIVTIVGYVLNPGINTKDDAHIFVTISVQSVPKVK